MKPLLRAFARCRRGAAAIEFALVAPILIVLHLGTVETVNAWEAHRRVEHIASALADLTAQNRTVTATDMADILAAGNLLISPYPTGQLGERIASVTASSTGAVKVDWTFTQNWTAGGTASVPNGYLQAGESVIVADVTYNHQTMFGLVLPKTMAMQNHAYLRPRLSTQVGLM